MEQEYLIGVANKFAAFIDESEDPYDIIKNVEAEKLKKKSLKAAANNDNKENKGKETTDQKSKVARKSSAKVGDRVLAVDKPVKTDNLPERAGNKRNRDEFGNNDLQRAGNKMDGGAPRGPKNTDAPKGEKRDGPRPPRGDNDGRRFGDGDGRRFGDGDGRRFGDGDGRRFGDGDGRRFGDGDGRRGGDNDGRRGGPRADGETRPFRQPGNDDGRPPRRERRDYNNAADAPDLEGRPDRRPPRGGGGGGGGGAGSGGGRGGSRPFGPGRNYDNRGKREFDRKSGSDRTGVKAVDKRDGAGSFNWDSNKDAEVLATDLNVTNNSEEADWDESGKEPEAALDVTPKDVEENVDESAAPVEEEPQELTLDEYRAMRGKRNLPQYDIRKPNEGEDLTQWKEMVEMKRKDQDEEADEELEAADYPQRVGRQRHVVGIDITFNDVFRGGRGRGGRGAGGGGGGRGRGQREREPRPDNGDQQQRRRQDAGGRQSAPKVDDEKAFPSLG